MERAARRLLGPVAALSFAVLAGATAAPGADPLAAIAAAAGYPAHVHFHAETPAARDENADTVVLDAAGPDRIERTCAAGLCHGTWSDGRRVFTFGINGTPFADDTADPALLATFTAIASTAFTEPAFVLAGGSVKPLPPAREHRERYEVSAPGGSPLVAVADARTGRLEAVERPDGTLLQSLVASGAGPVLYAARAYASVSVIAGPLEAPAGPRWHLDAPADLALLDGPVPIVPCRLAGAAARCLIDSGTTPSALTLAFAERLGREPRGSIEIAGLGSYLTGVVDAGPLQLGDARLESTHFAVVPHVRGAAFDVIVGSDALAGLRLGFEPERRRMTLEPADSSQSGTTVSGTQAQTLHLRFHNGLPVTDVRFAGRPGARSLLVDSGDTATVSIGYDAYRDDPDVFVPRGRSDASGLGARSMAAVDGELAGIDAGPVHLDRVPVAAVRGQHQGHLGYGFMRRCVRFTLDLAGAVADCTTGAPPARAPDQR